VQTNIAVARRGILMTVALMGRSYRWKYRRRSLNALSFHSLRRTATTLLHEAGIAGAVAQALIGHDSEAIHEHYVNVGREALQKAAARTRFACAFVGRAGAQTGAGQ
jgi:integrase